MDSIAPPSLVTRPLFARTAGSNWTSVRPAALFTIAAETLTLVEKSAEETVPSLVKPLTITKTAIEPSLKLNARPTMGAVDFDVSGTSIWVNPLSIAAQLEGVAAANAIPARCSKAASGGCHG